MAGYDDLLRSLGAGAGKVASPLLENGSAAELFRVGYKTAPDDSLFQLAFGFWPTINVGSALGVKNGLLRFAMDALLDPLELPFALTKFGRTANAARYLSTAEKGEQALKIAKFRGLSHTEGRGLEFMTAVRKGDVRTLRGMRDILDGTDEASLAFFRGEQGRALREAIFSPDEYKLQTGLANQLAAKQRGALTVRTPFLLRPLLGDHEAVLIGGAGVARLAEKVPLLDKWLPRIGERPLRNMALALHTADAATSGFRAAEAAGEAARQLADENPALRPLANRIEGALSEARPAYTEYRAARNENHIRHVDLGTLREEMARDRIRLATELGAGKAGATTEFRAFLDEGARVVGGTDIGPHYLPYLQEFRQTLRDLRDSVPAAWRPVLADYDRRLEAAIARPGAAAQLAGRPALDELIHGAARAAETEAETLGRGIIPGARGGEAEAIRTLRESEAGRTAAAREAAGKVETRRETLTRELDLAQEHLDRLRREGLPAKGTAGAEGRALAQAEETVARLERELELEAEHLTRLREEGLRPAAPPPEVGLRQGLSRRPSSQLEEALAPAAAETLRRQGREVALSVAQKAHLDRLEEQYAAAAEKARKLEEGITAGALREGKARDTEAAGLLRDAKAERDDLAQRIAALRSGVEAGPIAPTEELAHLGRLGKVAARRSVAARQLDELLVPARDLPDVPGITGAADRLVGALRGLAKDLPELTSPIRAKSGAVLPPGLAQTGLEHGAPDARVQRLAQALATVGGNLGVAAGGEVAAEFRKAIGKAWPELGSQLEDLHKNMQLDIRSQALEADLMAGLNPSYGHDFGGEGRNIRNLYGAGFDPRNMADAHFQFQGVLQARTRAWMEANREPWEKLAKDPERSVRFIRAFREDKEAIRLMDDWEVGLFHSAERLLEAFGATAVEKGWIEQQLLDYFPRMARRKAGVSRATLKNAYSMQAATLARASTSARNFKRRFIQSFDTLLEMEKAGLIEVEKNPAKLIREYIDGAIKVAANQRLVDVMMHNRGLDGLPLLVRRSEWAKTARALHLGPEAAGRYIEPILEEANVKAPALAEFLIHKDHADVLSVFGPQSVAEVIREDQPFWRALQRLNLGIKGGILSMSFFHAIAQSVSILAATGVDRGGSFLLSADRTANLLGRLGGDFKRLGPSPRMGNFLQLWGEAGQLVEHGIQHGLELDTFDKIASDEFKGFMSKMVEEWEKTPPGGTMKGPGGPMKVLRSPITGAKHLNDISHKVTWEYIHNSGKVFLYSEFLQRLLKDRPDIPFELAAKEAAATANRTLGGLAWRKVFGDARFRTRLQFLMLAPDWTLANLAQARDVFLGLSKATPGADGRMPNVMADVASPTAAGALARRFWFNATVGVLGTMQVLSYALSGHSTFENPEGEWNKVDLGRKDEDGRPLYLSFGKQFFEPFELATNPWKFVLGRASPIVSTTTAVVQQRDRFGGPISVPGDSTTAKSLQNLGYLTKSVLPIPLQNAVRGVGQLREGKTASGTATLANTVTSMFDLNIRPAPLLNGPAHAESEPPKGEADWDLPGTLPFRPLREARFVTMFPDQRASSHR